MKSAAVYYGPEGYSTRSQKIYGLNSALEGFLAGLLVHGNLDQVTAVAESSRVMPELNKLAGSLGSSVRLRHVSTARLEELKEEAALYLPGPGLGAYAWMRRRVGDRAFSLCGVTHTTATPTALDALVDLLASPTHPWDALVCPSASVKSMVETVLKEQGAYLAQRFGGIAPPGPQIPVIPLGVDEKKFRTSTSQRDQARTTLGLEPEDVAILFVGRISLISKAHLVPLFLALDRAKSHSERKLVLVLAGWFENESTRQAYEGAFSQLCFGVGLRLVDGTIESALGAAWRAADIFVSPSDNIQETFGLTPLEAMAAGLPVVVSDWDGYRETVRDGIDGFLVPTSAPPAEGGGDLEVAYGARTVDYSNLLAVTSQSISVSVGHLAEALVNLINNEALRRRLGASGRRRVEETYSWRHIIRRYENLWAELAEMRLRENNSPIGRCAYPARPNPFAAFEGYPSKVLSADMRLAGGCSAPELIGWLLESPVASFSSQGLISAPELVALTNFVKRDVTVTVGAIISQHSGAEARIWRSLAWLCKYDLIRIS